MIICVAHSADYAMLMRSNKAETAVQEGTITLLNLSAKECLLYLKKNSQKFMFLYVSQQKPDNLFPDPFPS